MVFGIGDTPAKVLGVLIFYLLKGILLQRLGQIAKKCLKMKFLKQNALEPMQELQGYSNSLQLYSKQFLPAAKRLGLRLLWVLFFFFRRHG